MFFKKLFDLVYNGSVVGSRVKYIGKVYDISNDDLRLSLEDFSINLDFSNSGKYVNLIEKGSLLVPVGQPSADELTYGVISQLKGEPHLAKSDVQLKLAYNQYNKEIFNDRLPRNVCVYWSNRMTADAGVARWKYKRGTGELFDIHIGLSVPYHHKYPNEIKDTLVHEMIHILHPKEGHGMWFHFEKDRINREHNMNITVYSTGHATERKKQKRKYIYACKKCGQEFPRVRRDKNDYKYSECGKTSCKGKIYLKHTLSDFDLEMMDTDVDMDW